VCERIAWRALLLCVAVLPAIAGFACGSDSKGDGERTPSPTGTAVATVASTSTPAAATATPAPPSATPTPGLPVCNYIPAGTTFTVTPPAAGIPAGIAAYSGAWEGLWGGAAANTSALIVRSVSATGVEAVYVFQGVTSPMNMDLPAGFTSGPINFGTSIAFTWSLSPDGTRLGGTRTSAGQAISVTMNRCRLP